MQQYLIIVIILINLIIFKLINSIKFKFNKKLLNIFCTVQFIFIFWIFINNNEVFVIKLIDSIAYNSVTFFKSLKFYLIECFNSLKK